MNSISIFFCFLFFEFFNAENISWEKKRVELIEGDNFNLKCEFFFENIQDYDLIRISKKYKNDKKITVFDNENIKNQTFNKNKFKTKIFLMENYGIFYISDVSIEDSGIWLCSVPTKNNDLFASFNLIVKPKRDVPKFFIDGKDINNNNNNNNNNNKNNNNNLNKLKLNPIKNKIIGCKFYSSKKIGNGTIKLKIDDISLNTIKGTGEDSLFFAKYLFKNGWDPNWKDKNISCEIKMTEKNIILNQIIELEYPPLPKCILFGNNTGKFDVNCTIFSPTSVEMFILIDGKEKINSINVTQVDNSEKYFVEETIFENSFLDFNLTLIFSNNFGNESIDVEINGGKIKEKVKVTWPIIKHTQDMISQTVSTSKTISNAKIQTLTLPLALISILSIFISFLF